MTVKWWRCGTIIERKQQNTVLGGKLNYTQIGYLGHNFTFEHSLKNINNCDFNKMLVFVHEMIMLQ